MTRRLTIEEMQSIATARGGRCLSTQYVNNNTPLEWECAQGHRWFAIASNIRKGSWCPACAVQQRSHSLAEVHQAAEARGGRVSVPDLRKPASAVALALCKGTRMGVDGTKREAALVHEVLSRTTPAGHREDAGDCRQARRALPVGAVHVREAPAEVAVPAGAHLDHEGRGRTEGALVSAVREP